MMLDTTTLAFIGNIGTPELIILALLGLLIFGKRLPEVGKSVGRGIVEFKKGLSGIEEDLDHAAREPHRLEADQAQRTDAPRPAETEPTSTSSGAANHSA